MARLKSQRRPLSLYVHVPFCDWKCTYCDFNSYAGLDALIPTFVEALLREIDLWAANGTSVGEGCTPEQRSSSAQDVQSSPAVANPADRSISTIFFGGGTPSLLAVPDLERILSRIYERFGVEEDAEITLEANPGTVDVEKLRGLREAGVNRLSIGVQSFQKDELRFLTRIHDADTARRAYHDARAAGFDNINLDFIFGLPGQTLESWQRTLEEAVTMGADHLSLYILTVEESTPLGHDVARGMVHEADADAVAELYKWTCERMTAAGYQQYEISNWSRHGAQCRHNLNYWRNGDYLGLGPGAHSHLSRFEGSEMVGEERCGVRFAVVRSPQRYIKLVASSEPAFPFSFHEQIEKQRLAQEMADTAWLALRLNDGLNLVGFGKHFGISFNAAFPGVVARFTAEGLLEEFAGHLRLTQRGRLLSNEVFVALVDS